MNEESPALSPAAVKAGWGWMAFDLVLLPQLVGLLGLDATFSDLLFHTLGFLATALIFYPALLDGFRWVRAHWKGFFLICALALAGYYAAGWAVSHLIGWLEPGFVNQNDQALVHQQWGLLFVTTVVLAPFSEECLFRGLLFSRLAERNRGIAYLLSCLCFGLIHVLGFLGQYSPLQFALALLQYLPAGLLLAWSYEKSQSLAAPIFIHTIINAISMVQMI